MSMNMSKHSIQRPVSLSLFALLRTTACTPEGWVETTETEEDCTAWLDGVADDHIQDGVDAATLGGTGTNNSTNRQGGGVDADTAESLTVKDCSIIKNQATHGGGVVGPADGTLTIRDTPFIKPIP